MRVNMRSLCLLGILILFVPPACANGSGELNLSLDLIRGEHSKDSNSTETKIEISGDQASFDVTYQGRPNPYDKPIHKTVTLSSDDIKRIKKLLSRRQWFPDEKRDFVRAGAITYFTIGVEVGVGKSTSNLTLTGTPANPLIKVDEKYLYVNSLLTEVFRILHDHDAEINFVDVVD